MLDFDIQYLWYEQKVEEDFVRVIVQTGFDLLQSKKINDKKDVVFELISKCISKFGGEE